MKTTFFGKWAEETR